MRDIKFALRELMIEMAGGQAEATSHMQINWRRVKKLYFEVYLFRSALTANAVSAVRRTTVIITALQLRLGRFRACRAGLSDERLEAHKVCRPREARRCGWRRA